MKVFSAFLLISSFLLLSNCSASKRTSTYRIDYKEICPSDEKSLTNRSNDFYKGIKSRLFEFFSGPEFSITGKDVLFLETKKDYKTKLDSFKNQINGPSFTLHKLLDYNDSEIEKSGINFSSIPNFNYIERPTKDYLAPNIIGYIDDKNFKEEINKYIATNNSNATAVDFIWTKMKFRHIYGSKNDFYLLQAVRRPESAEAHHMNKYFTDVKVHTDYDTFEPVVMLIFNECGIHEIGKLLNSKDAKFTVAVDNEAISVRPVKISNQNQMLLFGFKKLEQVEELVQSVKLNTKEIEFTKLDWM